MSLDHEHSHIHQRKVRFSILLKQVFIIISLVSATGFITTWQNAELFKKISSEREENANINMASSKALETNNLIVALIEKIKYFGLQLVKDSDNDNQSSLKTSFRHDKDLLALEVKQKKLSGNPKLLESLVSEKSLEEYKYPSQIFDKIRNNQSFPIDKIFTGEIFILIEKQKDIPPILVLGLPLLKNSKGNVDHVALAYIRLDRLQKSFANPSERLLYLIDSNGNIMAHPDENLIYNITTQKSPIILDALKSQNIRIKQKKFTDPIKKENFVGAFAKTSYGPIVISQSSESIILAPSKYVKRQGYFILGIVLSTAFYLIFSFSSTLSRPIKKLVTFSEKISHGDFDIHVSHEIKSHDEVGVLASAFDNMIIGLRERDKIKNIFNKFHGSSVAEELLTSSLNREGKKKEVTVFFSDIRGFTSFSETHSPEEVVQMLNSYFDVMVKIINQYGGVVDKFIGDAIMAVWGIPSPTEDDAGDAILACLEMRAALEDFNDERIKNGKDPIWIGIGLHTGEVISGTVGAEDRMEYTIIGDTVNVASRIESCTKLFGTDLLVSELLAKKVSNHYILEAVGESKVKGKSDSMMLYKVNGVVNDQGEQTLITTSYSDFDSHKDEKVKVA